MLQPPLSRLNQLFSVAGKVALVTGASSGLGRQFSRTLALHGARVIVAARREEKLSELVAELTNEGVSESDLYAVGMDIKDKRSIDEAVIKGEKAFGQIDILVNNAGIVVTKPALKMTEEDWTSVLDTNVTGHWFLSQTVANRMVKQKISGCIINISSIAGLMSPKYMASYCASKAALIQLTKVLANEWARYDIRVNCIAPGYILTEMNSQFFETEEGKELIARIPQKKIGHPSDLDGMLLLMCSAAGNFMTGSVVNIDGGILTSCL